MYGVMDDAQSRPVGGTCEVCGGELWGEEAEEDQWGHVLCPTCREEREDMERYDPATALAVIAAMDAELRKYLADGPRDKIWNALVARFPVEEAV